MARTVLLMPFGRGSPVDSLALRGIKSCAGWIGPPGRLVVLVERGSALRHWQGSRWIRIGRLETALVGRKLETVFGGWGESGGTCGDSSVYAYRKASGFRSVRSFLGDSDPASALAAKRRAAKNSTPRFDTGDSGVLGQELKWREKRKRPVCPQIPQIPPDSPKPPRPPQPQPPQPPQPPVTPPESNQ